MRRPQHPLEGQRLEIFREVRRGGKDQLLVILPDGTRSLIPASWTDYACDASRHGSRDETRIGTTSQLFSARVVVDALLRRLPASEGEIEASLQEDRRADAAVPETGSGVGLFTGGSVEDAVRGETSRAAAKAGSSDPASSDGSSHRGRGTSVRRKAVRS